MPSPGKEENDGDAFFPWLCDTLPGSPFPDKASTFLHRVQGRVYECAYLDGAACLLKGPEERGLPRAPGCAGSPTSFSVLLSEHSFYLAKKPSTPPDFQLWGEEAGPSHPPLSPVAAVTIAGVKVYR